MPTFLLAFAACAISLSATAAQLKVGDPLPDATAPDQDGKPLSLQAYGSKGYLLIYFYPKADTPGCTKQACSLRDGYAELQKRGVKILGASLDTPEKQKAFQAKYKLPFSLLADKEKVIVSAFGVPTGITGLAKRQAYLFENGKCVWVDYAAATDKQAEDVLAFLDSKKK
ncbi:MAG: peroxiredoxin [Puniceicoccales bacterium]|nr:peroxiredoxin [Puniceicoccales bacterium]